MTRYAKQPNDYLCAPYALLNILKWAGVKKYKGKRVNSSLAKNELANLCNCTWWGVGDKQFDLALHSLPGIEIKKIRGAELKQVRKHVQNKGAAVLGFYYLEKDYIESHYTLVIEEQKKGLLCINYEKDTYRMVPFEDLKKMFGFKYKPNAWLISKKK
jgi:hypothetical protein